MKSQTKPRKVNEPEKKDFEFNCKYFSIGVTKEFLIWLLKMLLIVVLLTQQQNTLALLVLLSKSSGIEFTTSFDAERK